ncbi:MAG: alcohol dehydrogenase catalytic domain-containing protein [Streptomycetaceae bacterium]|uniref:Zn-dependent alcohol dehydrogenase n=1 Tax=Yinghuangia aomiensis TaxID=676205 RepID=A0ABP9HLH4_9ACTN|nr:alcohol dehydrogenase catalytic domain-containing protein [Streptomycetaceae bacterium]NUS54870.1 alcohol dehydrogenase catalytic domain-containing protein [Streptomycetaceae bacterium]
MRAILHTDKGVEIRDDVEIREPEAGEVLVRIAATGVCHSDVSVLEGVIEWPAPAVLGHEGAGIVERVGAGVTAVKPGDHVVITTIAACGMCRYCQTGHPNRCRQTLGNRSTPFSVDGQPVWNFAGASTYAELTLVKEIQCVTIPEDVPLTSACLVPCGVVTGAGAVLNRANILPGQTAAVIGLGGVGLAAVQALRLKGAGRVVGVDTVPGKFDLARKFGATDFVQAGKGIDVADEIRTLFPYSADQKVGTFGAGGVDWIFECTGVPAVLENALEALDWGGTLIAVGQPSQTATANIRIANLLQCDRGILGTRAGGVRPHEDIRAIVELYRQGKFDLDALVSKVYPSDGFHDVLDDMHNGRIARGVLKF